MTKYASELLKPGVLVLLLGGSLRFRQVNHLTYRSQKRHTAFKPQTGLLILRCKSEFPFCLQCMTALTAIV